MSEAAREGRPALGLHIHYGHRGLRSVAFHPAPEGFSWKFFKENRNPHLEEAINQWLEEYLEKKQPSFSLPLDWGALSSFTIQVLKQVAAISFGSILSYGQVAHLLGRPEAARAVGGACGRNPFPLFVPCHRVLDASFALRGFSAGGLSVKRELLEFEGAFYQKSSLFI